MNKKRNGISMTRRIVQDFEEKIRDGVLEAGAKLPSVRDLAEQYAISTAVCLSSYRALEKMGLVERRAGSGTYVKGTPARESAGISFFNWNCIFPALTLEKALGKFAPELAIDHFPALEYNYNRQYLEFLRSRSTGEERQPGLAALDEGQLPHLAYSGALLPLDGLLEESGLDRSLFPPELLRAMSWNGKLYALPVSWRSLMLLYNRNVFRDCSFPEPDASWQWDDLMAAAIRLTEGEQERIRRYGLAVLFTPNSYIPFIRQAGGEVFDSNGNCSIDSDAAFEGLNFYSELLRLPGVCSHLRLGAARNSLAELVSHGLAAMLLGDGTDYLLLKERMAPGEWGAVPPPGKYCRKGSLSVWGIGLTPGSRPEKRFRLLEQFFQPESYRSFCADIHSLPAYAPAANGVEDFLLKLLPGAVPSLQNISPETSGAVTETIDPLLLHKVIITRDHCREFQNRINARL